MASLTETAYYSRQTIKWGFIGLIVLTILRIVFAYLIVFIHTQFPAPPLIVDNKLGVLPAVKFPQTASPSAQITFTLRTVQGTIPTASDAARVYFMPKTQSSHLSLPNAQAVVNRIGFRSTPKLISNTRYRWIDTQNPLRTLELDIVSYHFSLTYLYVHDLNLFVEKQVPSPQQAVTEAYAYFRTLQFEIPDVDVVAPKVEYLKLVGDKLDLATSQSQADAVRIDFFRLDYSGMRVLTDNPDQGVLSFVLSGSKRQDKRILSVKYTYWPIDQVVSGVYKLKPGEQAWEELKAGKGYYAKLPKGQTNIAITNVYLAYYDSTEPQLYMQPVFVFEGDPDFVAYLPAIAPPWTE